MQLRAGILASILLFNSFGALPAIGEPLQGRRSWSRRLQVHRTASIHLATPSQEIFPEGSPNASFPIVASEGETLTLRAWPSVPAVEEDIEVRVALRVVAAGTGSTLSDFTIIPSVRFIEAFETQSLADAAEASGNWSNAGGALGANANFVEFSITLPDDSIPSAGAHLFEAIISSNGSVNGTFDGYSEAFRFYVQDDDVSGLSFTSSIDRIAAAFDGTVELTATLASSPFTNVSITIGSQALAGSDQSEPPFVPSSSSSSQLTGGSELSTTGATFFVQLNDLFDFSRQAELEGSGSFDVDVAIYTSSTASGFNGLAASVTVTVVVETVFVSIRAVNGSSMASTNSTHLVLQEGAATAQHVEVLVSGTVTDTIIVDVLSNSSNPVFFSVPADERAVPYADSDGALPVAFTVSPSTLFFTPDSPPVRVLQVLGQQNAVVDGLREGSIQLRLNASAAQSSDYEVGNGTVTVAVLDDDFAGIAVTSIPTANGTAVENATESPATTLQLTEGDAALLRVGTLTSPFAPVDYAVEVFMDGTDNDGVEAFLFAHNDSGFAAASTQLQLSSPAGLNAGLVEDTSSFFYLRLTESSSRHDGGNRTATVRITSSSSDGNYAGLSANVSVNIIEKAEDVEVRPIPVVNPHLVVVEGSVNVSVGTVSLSAPPDAFLYRDGTLQVFAVEVTQYALNELGRDEVLNATGNSSIADRTLEPALADGYPVQLETVLDGFVAVLEFNESNWQEPQEVRVSVAQDQLAEVELISTYLAFFAESPEMTQGTEVRPPAAGVMALIHASAAENNSSRLETEADRGFDVIVADDDSAEISVRVESSDSHGVASWDIAFPGESGVTYATGGDLRASVSSVQACGNGSVQASTEAVAAGVHGGCVVLREQEAAYLVVEASNGLPVFPLTVTLSIAGLGGYAGLLNISESSIELSEGSPSVVLPLLSRGDSVATASSVVFSQVSVSVNVSAAAGSEDPFLSDASWGRAVVGTQDDDVPYILVSLDGADGESAAMVAVDLNASDAELLAASSGSTVFLSERELSEGLAAVHASMIRNVDGDVVVSVEAFDYTQGALTNSLLASGASLQLAGMPGLPAGSAVLGGSDNVDVDVSERNVTVLAIVRVFDNGTTFSGEQLRLEFAFAGRVVVHDDDEGTVHIERRGTNVFDGRNASSGITASINGSSPVSIMLVFGVNGSFEDDGSSISGLELVPVGWNATSRGSLAAWGESGVLRLEALGFPTTDAIFVQIDSPSRGDVFDLDVLAVSNPERTGNGTITVLTSVISQSSVDGWTDFPQTAEFLYVDSDEGLELFSSLEQVALIEGEDRDEHALGNVSIEVLSESDAASISYTISASLSVVSGAQAGIDDVAVDIMDADGVVVASIGGPSGSPTTELTLTGPFSFRASAPVDSDAFEPKASIDLKFALVASPELTVESLIGGPRGEVTVSLFVYEAPDIVIMNPQVFHTAEGGEMASIQVRLSSIPGQPDGPGSDLVTVDVGSAVEAAGLFASAEELAVEQLVVQPATLTFDRSNWNVTQAVEVTAVDDSFVEPAVLRAKVELTVAANSTAWNYLDVESAAAGVDIMDNDAGIFEWSTASVSLEENGPGASLELVPSATPLLGNATVSLSAVATGQHPLYSIAFARARVAGEGGEWTSLVDFVAVSTFSSPNVSFEVDFRGLDFVLQGNETYDIHASASSASLPGLDYESSNSSEPDVFQLLLADTTVGVIQLVYGSEAGQTIIETTDVPRELQQSSPSIEYAARLSAIPPPHGNVSVQVTFERRNSSLITGMAPVPVVNSDSMTVRGFGLASPEALFQYDLGFGVTIPDDNRFYGAQIDFALALSSTDTYGGELSSFVLPVEHIVSVSYENRVGLVVSASSLLVAEGAPAVQYTVSLATNPLEPVTVAIASAFDGSEVTLGGPAEMVFSSSNWNVPQTASVQAIVDGAGAPDEPAMESTIVLTPTSVDSFYNSLASVQIGITVTDEVGIEVEAVSVGSASLDDGSAIVTNLTEGAAADGIPPVSSVFRYRVRLTAPPTAGTVSIAAAEDVAARRAASGRSAAVLSVFPSSALTFSATNFNDWQEIVVTLLDDSVDEGSRASTVVSHAVQAPQDPRYDGRFVPRVIVGFTDNDAAALVVTHTFAAVELVEGDQSGSFFDVALATRPVGNVTVLIDSDRVDASVGGSGGLGTDYGVAATAAEVNSSSALLPGSVYLRFDSANWADSQRVVLVASSNDGTQETEEGFLLSLSTMTSSDTLYSGLSSTSVSVLVYDPVGVALDGATAFEVLEGPDEPDAGSRRLEESNATSFSYGVRILSPPLRGSTVRIVPSIQVTSSVAGVGVEQLIAVPAQASFTRSNWKNTLQISLEAPPNSFAEGDVPVVVSHRAESAEDARYSGLTNDESDAFSGRVLDDDAPGFIIRRIDTAVTAGLPLLGTDSPTAVGPDARRTPTWTAAGAEGLQIELREGERRTMELRLSSTPFQAVQTDLVLSTYADGLLQMVSTRAGLLDFQSSGRGTADAVTSFTAASWDFPVSLDVLAPADFIDRGETYQQTLQVVAAAAGTQYENVSIPVTVLIHDDDTAAVRVVQSADFVIEEGASGQFFLRLGTAPSGTVTLHVSADGFALNGDVAFEGAVTAAPASIAFTPENWQTPRAVALTPSDNAAVFRGSSLDQLRSIQANITVLSAPSDPAYAGLVGGSAQLPRVAARITEDDIPGIVVDQSYLLLGEGGVGGTPSFGTVSLTLQSPPTDAVTVTAVASQQQVSVAPAAVVRTSTNWQVPVTFTITALDDSSIEGTQTDSVSMSMTSLDPDYSAPQQVVNGEERGVDESLLQVAIELLDNDVEAALDTTPAPVLSRVFLVETSHEVEFVFDRSTTMAGRTLGLAGQQSCSGMQVLDPATLISVGGTSAVCYWPANDRLRVVVGSAGGQPVEPKAGVTMTIRRGTIKATAASIFSASGFATLQGRLPVPAIQSVRFSATGASLTVQFTSQTSQLLADGPRAGPCSRVFENWQLLGVAETGAAAASCTFQSSTSMSVRLGIGATVTPLLLFDALAPCANTTYGLTLREGAIRSVAGSVNSADRTCTIVAGPSVAVSPPVASVTGPERISFCDGIELDGSSTTGGGGRALSFSWDVSITAMVGATTAQREAAELALQTALVESQSARQAQGLRAGIVAIQNATLLPAGSTVVFEMRAQSFLSVVPGVATHTVSVEDQPLPLISIQGSRRLEIRASQVVRLSVDAQLPSCDTQEAASTEALAFTWTTALAEPWSATASSDLAIPALPSLQQYVTRGGRTLQLPSRLVVPGGRYLIRAQAALPSRPSVSNFATIELLVSGEGLRARISGGASREIGQSQTVKFDATASEDRDDFSLAQVGSEQYSWQCVELPDTEDEEAALIASQFAVVGGVVVEQDIGSLFPQCTDTTGREIDFNLRTDPAHGPQSDPAAGLPSLGPRNLGEGRYRLSVTYSRGTNTSAGALLPRRVRSATASVDLAVVSGSPPIITSAGIAGNPDKISAAVRSRLQATVTLGSSLAPSEGDLSYLWSVVTTDSAFASRVFATSPAALEVTLRPGVLEPGSSYEFTFQVVDLVTGGSTSSRVDVLVNQPPFSGFLAVQPLQGVLLQTGFNLQAVQWTDDPEDLPLRYLFGYYLSEPALVLRAAEGALLDGEEAPQFVPISDQFSSTDSTSDIKLPRGVGSSNQLTLAVRVSDRLGATTTAFFGSDGLPVSVRIDPPVVEDADAAIELVQQQQEQLDQTLLSGDSARVLSDLAAMAEVLAIVPDDPCDGIECQDGERCYIGNCVNEVETVEDDGGGGLNDIPVVLACPGSSPSRQRAIDVLTGREMLVPGDECSGNGVCIRTPTMCAEADTTGCQAICSCNDGGQPNDPWSGSDCARRESDIQALQEKRQQLLEVQLRASDQLEGTEEAIAQHAATLGGLSKQTDSLGESGQELALALAERLSNAALNQQAGDSEGGSEDDGASKAVSRDTAGSIMGVIGVLFDTNQVRYASLGSRNESNTRRRLEAAAELLDAAGSADPRREVADGFQRVRRSLLHAEASSATTPRSRSLAGIDADDDAEAMQHTAVPTEARWNPLWWLGSGHDAAEAMMREHDVASELRGVLPESMIGHQRAEEVQDVTVNVPFFGQMRIPMPSSQLSWLRVEHSMGSELAMGGQPSSTNHYDDELNGGRRVLAASLDPTQLAHLDDILDAAALAEIIPWDLAMESSLPDPAVLALDEAPGRRLERMASSQSGYSGTSSAGDLRPGQLRVAAYRLLQVAGEEQAPSAAINESQALAQTLRLRATAESLSRSASLDVTEGEEAQTITGGSLTTTSLRVSISEAQNLQLGSGAEMVLPLGGVSGLLNNDTALSEGGTASDSPVDLRGIAWSTNPYLWSDIIAQESGSSPTRGGGVVSMEIAGAPASAGGSGTGASLDVSQLRCPLLLRLPVADSISEAEYECRFFDESSGRDFTEGMVLLRFERDSQPDGTVQRMAICATLHLTDFSSQVEEDLPQINAVDPIGNAGLLRNYLDPRNFFVLIILCVLFGAFMLAAGVSFCLYRASEDERKDLARAQFIRYGELRQGRGLDKLHKDEEKEVDPEVQRLREARKSGTAFLVVQHIWLTWVDRLRRHHGWGSVFSPPLDEQLRMTVSQRIGILCATCLASMAVNAVFFGTAPSRVSGRVLVALISTLIMLPVNEFFPYLFTTVNSVQSSTLEERRQAILKRRERMKRLRAHAERIQQLTGGAQRFKDGGGKVAPASGGMLDDGDALRSPPGGRGRVKGSGAGRGGARTGSVPAARSAGKYMQSPAAVRPAGEDVSMLASADGAAGSLRTPDSRAQSADAPRSGTGKRNMRKKLNIKVTSVSMRKAPPSASRVPFSTKAGERQLPPPPKPIDSADPEEENSKALASARRAEVEKLEEGALGTSTPISKVSKLDGAGPEKPAARARRSDTVDATVSSNDMQHLSGATVVAALGLEGASSTELLCAVGREKREGGAAGEAQPAGRRPGIVRAIEAAEAKAQAQIRSRTRAVTTTKRRVSLSGASGGPAAPGRFQSKAAKQGAANSRLTHKALFAPPPSHTDAPWMALLPVHDVDPARLLAVFVREELAGGPMVSGESIGSAPGLVASENEGISDELRQEGLERTRAALDAARRRLIDSANEAIQDFQERTQLRSNSDSDDDLGGAAFEADAKKTDDDALKTPRGVQEGTSTGAKLVFRAPLSLIKSKSKRRMVPSRKPDEESEFAVAINTGGTPARRKSSDGPEDATGLLQSPTTAEQGGVAFPGPASDGTSKSGVANGVAALAADDDDLRQTLQEIQREHALRNDSRGVLGSGASREIDDADSVVSDASGISEDSRSRSMSGNMQTSSRSFSNTSSRSVRRKRMRRRTMMLGSILDARPLTACEHTMLSALTVLNLVQVWAAFVGVLFCFYLVAGEAYRFAGPLRTIIITVSSSVVFGTMGLFGYFQARQHSFVGSTSLWFISIAVQATGATLLVVLDGAFLREIAIMVFGLQLVPGLAALAAYIAFVVVQWRIEQRMKELAKQVDTMGQDEKQLEAVVRVQAAYRRFHAVQEKTRRKELNVWQSDEVTSQRYVIAGFVYGCLFLVVSLSFYIVLLYGVLFTPQQARAWILASFISFLTDIFIQEPVIQLFLSVVDFIKKLADSSARSIVLASLASRAGLSAADIAAGLKQADMYRSRRSVAGSVGAGASAPGNGVRGKSHRSMRPSTVTFADLLVEPTAEDKRREAAAQEVERAASSGMKVDDVLKEEVDYDEEVDEFVDSEYEKGSASGAAAAVGNGN